MSTYIAEGLTPENVHKIIEIKVDWSKLEAEMLDALKAKHFKGSTLIKFLRMVSDEILERDAKIATLESDRNDLLNAISPNFIYGPDATGQAKKLLTAQRELLDGEDKENAQLRAELSAANQAVICEGFENVVAMISRYKQVLADSNEVDIAKDAEMEELRKRLADSERREKAAVELIAKLHEYLQVLDGATEYIKPGTGVWHTTKIAIDAIKEWRGPREADEGRRAKSKNKKR